MPARRDGSHGGGGDAALFASLARGDLDALGALFDRYHGAVRSVVLHAGVPRDDADDAVQDTFLRLAATAARYDGRDDGRAWVLGTAWRVAAERRRTVRRFLRALTRFADAMPPTVSRTPEDDRHTAERVEAFIARVAALPEKMRAAYVLVEVQGVATDEAARALDIPVATVWTRLHHARKRMLDDDGGPP